MRIETLNPFACESPPTLQISYATARVSSETFSDGFREKSVNGPPNQSINAYWIGKGWNGAETHTLLICPIAKISRRY